MKRSWGALTIPGAIGGDGGQMGGTNLLEIMLTDLHFKRKFKKFKDLIIITVIFILVIQYQNSRLKLID